jgi:hypothetical protein
LRAPVVTANDCQIDGHANIGVDASEIWEYPKRKFVTAVTSSEAESEHVNRAVDTDASLVPQPGFP